MTSGSPGFDAAAIVEVIEHLDPPRLAAFERVVFEFARPATIVLTTPNREYNVTWPNLAARAFRHDDHRFEWTREEFQAWATGVASRYGYSVKFLPDGAGTCRVWFADADGESSHHDGRSAAGDRMSHD